MLKLYFQKLHFQTTFWNTAGTRIDRLSQRFRPIAARTRVYAANSKVTATHPLSPWERVREKAVSRKPQAYIKADNAFTKPVR